MSDAFKSMFERTSTLTDITADDYAVVLVNGNLAKIKYSDVVHLFGTATSAPAAGSGTTAPAGTGPTIASGAYVPTDQTLTLTKSDGSVVTISLANLLSSVVKPGDTGLFPGVVQFAGAEVQRYQYIETNIPVNSAVMVRLDLIGYPYGPGGFTDLSISFYTYADPLGINLLYNPSYISRGTLEPAGLSGGFVNGKLVLAIDWGSAIYFNRYVINAHCNSAASNKNFFTGWAVKNGELPPTADHSKPITKKFRPISKVELGFDLADIELINQKLVALDTGLKTHYHSPLDGLVTTISNDETPGITYALKIGGPTTRIPWCVARASSVGEGVLFDYAGPINNPTMTNASMAWNTRATLQYGTAQQA